MENERFQKLIDNKQMLIKSVYIVMIFLGTMLFPLGGQAYLHSTNQSGSLIKWPSRVSLVDIYVNATNTQGLVLSDVNSIFEAAISEWDGKSKLGLRKNSTLGTNQESLNEIYFSTDPNYFNGGGVVGVTLISYSSTTGEIFEGDILINDSFSFSVSVNDENYLGNVVTHELGHFLGLAHGQVIGSTMFFSLARGQSGVTPDDVAGLYSLYPYVDSTKGTITGKIVGGPKLVGVFGAHVQALSLKTGKIAGAVFSNEKGEFAIGGLSLSDYYYLYTAPMNLNGAPERFDGVKSNFCSKGSSYRGSFFTACGASKEGFPQAIKLTSKEISVGNVSISCELSTPPQYMANKNTTPAAFDLQENVLSGIGNSFTGFFSAQEIQLGNKYDYFKIDLSQIDWTEVAPTGNLYLELKVISQLWYSPFKANVNIKRDSVTADITPKYSIEADGWPTLDTLARVLIDRATPSDNVFEITVTPESMVSPYFPSAIPYLSEDYFPSMSSFYDPIYFYLAQFSVVKDLGAGSYSLVSFKTETLSDNTYCAEVPGTYSLTSYTLGQNNQDKKKASVKSESAVACGSIALEDSSSDDDLGKGGAKKTNLIQFLLSFLIGILGISVVSRVFLSRKF